MEINFSGRSLVLTEGGITVFESAKKGLRPLVECLRQTEFKDGKNYELFDKIMGLAAARLVVRCGNIKTVHTQVLSQPAKELLQRHSVAVRAETVSRRILAQDGTSLCPMEEKALAITDDGQYFAEINKIFF